MREIVLDDRETIPPYGGEGVGVRGARLTEFNKCHSPADGKFCSTGATPAVTGRWGRAPQNDFERGAKWYSFPSVIPKGTVRQLAELPLDTIADDLDKAAYQGGAASVVAYLKRLAPRVPAGYELVLRMGVRGEKLAGSNAANLTGMDEFLRQMTEEYDLTIRYGFELESRKRSAPMVLGFYAVRMQPDPKGYKGGFKKGGWGRGGGF